MNARLVVLGLLQQEPTHGYDILKRIELLHAGVWADILPGSIYHALKQLQQEGLVEVRSTERTGHRLRAIFAITAVGRRAYIELLRHAWTTSPRPFPTGLYAAIAFLHDLPQAEVLALVEALLPAVEREVALWGRGEVATGAALAPSVATHAVFVNGREHLEADLRLLHTLRGQLTRSRPADRAAHQPGSASDG